jgi:hypothetical protein
LENIVTTVIIIPAERARRNLFLRNIQIVSRETQADLLPVECAAVVGKLFPLFHLNQFIPVSRKTFPFICVLREQMRTQKSTLCTFEYWNLELCFCT